MAQIASLFSLLMESPLVLLGWLAVLLAARCSLNSNNTMADDQQMSEKKSGGSSQPLHHENSSVEDSVCPLFMDGLPTNFKTNPSLAAIASLLNESDEDYDNMKKQIIEEKECNSDSISASEKKMKVELKSGGGKVQRKQFRQKGSSPYSKDGNTKKRKEDKNTASLGEAQLFLNMWKL